MSALRTTLRLLMWTAIAIVAVPVVLYLFALAVNWRDQPPNAEALELASTVTPDPIPDSANAYVYALGFAVPRVGDPALIGATRAEWIRALATDVTIDSASDPYPGSAPEFQQIPEPLAAVLTPCSTPDAGCAAAFDAAAGNLREQLEQQRPLIERYRTLLGLKAWREVTTGDLRGPLASYLEPRYAQQLFLLDTWLLAAGGDAEQVRARLEDDLTFWRMALAESDSLLSKVIAARFVGIHFEWGNLILRKLPRERRADGVPAAWRKSLTDSEHSMRRVFAYEWRFSRAALQSMKAYGTESPLPAGTRDSRSTLERIETRMFQPFLQVQDSLNRNAVELLKLDALLNAPYTELGAALARAPEIERHATGVIAATYNFLGDALFATPGRAASFADYGARAADLEGVRRAALLTADLRNLAIPAELAGTMIPLAAVRDPYTGGPFVWTAEPPAVTFTGLERRGTLRHSFLY
jgi:hypothetical protein